MCPFLTHLQVSVYRVLRALLVLSMVAVLLVPSGVAAERSDELGVLIIVNRQNATTTVNREFLRRAFLKQVTRWGDDETIRPADLAPTAAIRKKFSEGFLGRTVEAVRSYWQQRVFSGRDLPPPEFATEDAVVEYVSRHPGAIGYVSAGTGVGSTKVLVVH